jgi:DNA helicase HerA-like ATPase
MSSLHSQNGVNQTATAVPAGSLHGYLGTIINVGTSSLIVAVNSDQIEASHLAKSCRIGSVIKVPVEECHIYGTVQTVEMNTEAGGQILLTVDLLGELSGQGFSRGVRHFPMPGSQVYAANDADLDASFAPKHEGTIKMGTVFPSENTPGGLNAETLLSRHFAVLGSTGTGKSSTVALLMHRLTDISPAAHVIILDPHNEYERAFLDNGVHLSTENFSLPYWLMNFEEHVELLVGSNTEGRESDIDILKRCLFGARKRSAPSLSLSRFTVDTPIPYKLTELVQIIDDEMGKLDKAEDLSPFFRLKNKIEELRSDQRFAFMFSGLLVQDNLSETVAKLMRFPTNGRPVTTLDLSGVPNEIVDVVVSLLSRVIFDFAMWSQKHSSANPILLVCEEAHRYVPHTRLDGNNRVQAARKSLERIAKEGRKYGVSLGLVSQRPSDLSEAVLSQCGTILSMRMNNEQDRAFVENAMPEGTSSLLSALPTLQNRECIVAGEGVACPVRLQLDYLEEHLRPASNDPSFLNSWRQDVDCPEELVNDTILRWRKGVR